MSTRTVLVSLAVAGTIALLLLQDPKRPGGPPGHAGDTTRADAGGAAVETVADRRASIATGGARRTLGPRGAAGASTGRDPRELLWIYQLREPLDEDIGYIYRRIRDGFEARGWRFPLQPPRITTENAERLQREYEDYWRQQELAAESYADVLRAARDAGGGGNGGVFATSQRFPTLRAYLRDRYGDAFNERGHLATLTDGGGVRWAYFPPESNPTLDELDAWVESFVESAPDVYRRLVTYFVF